MRNRPACRRVLALAVTAGLVTATAACGSKAETLVPAAGDPTATASASQSAAPSVEGVSMKKPSTLTKPAVFPDILIVGQRTLSAATIKKITALPGAKVTDVFSKAEFYDEESPISYAAVDPATFRRFTPSTTAKAQAVWQRVAGGEMAISETLGKKLQDSKGYVRMGGAADAEKVHVGAYAPMVDRASGLPVIDAVVNEKWAAKLGMKRDNAMFVSTQEVAPSKVLPQIQRILGKSATAQILAVNLPVGAYQTAVLTGGSVAAAVGTLRYTANANGSVNPDPAWVKEYIRTEQVPILGTVTCNKVMLPSLRAALTEVVQRGLADKIHKSEYGGCFVPRFIAGTNQLSFHSFGTALDMNVPGNLRGSRGEMDRTVVAIFEKWGFGWGGDWRYTDPMHFELHKIVRPG